MHFIDISVFVLYMLAMLGVGVYFLRKNSGTEDYYVGGRQMGSLHVGLSVVATDVGGGFSIGLGGLGFVMGLSGSWMLFTGLLGAWLSGVLLIPRIAAMGKSFQLQTFPQVFGKVYGPRVALIAGLISAIGYLGFTSSQLLAGAKLASATFPELSLLQALLIMGVIAVVYTVMGGIKAVIYTDTVQWALLMGGLVFIGIPVGYNAIGGMEALRTELAPAMLQLSNISGVQLINWAITIMPIWFVGMTLYQRIFACRSEKEAKKAWFIAGLFEWPIMAFMGVLLGLFAKVAWQQGMFAELGFPSGGDIDPEMGLPLLLRTVLPVGLMGIMMASYFSAIMSTADSCLMAASGNIMTDIFKGFFDRQKGTLLMKSQLVTLGIGLLAIVIATTLESVLDLMLLSYAFMVSGLFVPVLGMLFWKKSSAAGAGGAMISGGLATSLLTYLALDLPLGLDPNVFGISISLVVFVALSYLMPDKKTGRIWINYPLHLK
jgi:SSS family solute:Na+ symporter